MSYYPPPHPGGSSYPYSTYHPPAQGAYGQTGSYPTTPYQTTYPPTAVTGYGAQWPYYGYFPQQSAQTGTTTARPTVPAMASTSTAVPTSTPGAPPPVRAAPATSTYTFSTNYGRESVAAAATGGATGRGRGRQSTHKGLFTKELRNLMYGFGDDRNPANDTVNVMEEILIEYITDVCQTSLAPGKKSRLSIEDLRRALSRPADAKKLARMEELLFMQEDIKRARAQFEESDMNQASSFQS